MFPAPDAEHAAEIGGDPIDFPGYPRLVPTQFAGHHRCDRVQVVAGRTAAGAAVGPPQDDIGQRDGHLFAHGMDDLGLQQRRLEPQVTARFLIPGDDGEDIRAIGAVHLFDMGEPGGMGLDQPALGKVVRTPAGRDPGEGCA